MRNKWRLVLCVVASVVGVLHIFWGLAADEDWKMWLRLGAGLSWFAASLVWLLNWRLVRRREKGQDMRQAAHQSGVAARRAIADLYIGRTKR